MKLKLFVFILSLSVSNTSWNMNLFGCFKKQKAKEILISPPQTSEKTLRKRLYFEDKPSKEQIKLAREILKEQYGVNGQNSRLYLLKRIIPETEYTGKKYTSKEFEDLADQIRLIMVASYSIKNEPKFLLDYKDLIEHLTKSLKANLFNENILWHIRLVLCKMISLNEWIKTENLYKDKDKITLLEIQYADLLMQVAKSVILKLYKYGSEKDELAKILVKKIGKNKDLLKSIENFYTLNAIDEFNTNVKGISSLINEETNEKIKLENLIDFSDQIYDEGQDVNSILQQIKFKLNDIKEEEQVDDVSTSNDDETEFEESTKLETEEK